MDHDPAAGGGLRYPEYLRIRDLLALQRPVSRPAHHDETLFIVVHQVFELWFKLMLHDLDAACRSLAEDAPRVAMKLVRRAALTIRRLIDQVDVLEGMSALDFLEFRDELEGASGFQSAQFREIEALLGLAEPERVPVALGGGRPGWEAYRGLLAPDERERVERRLSAPGLEEVFLGYLRRQPGAAAGDRGYLADLPDLFTAGEAAAAVIPELSPAAEVVDREDLESAQARLQRLPFWVGLDPGERSSALAAAGRARLVEALTRRGRTAVTGEAVVAIEALDAELAGHLTVALPAVEEALARAGIDAGERARIGAALDARRRLRRIYRRAGHRPGPDDCWDSYQVAEALVELGNAFHLFRFRHVKMVERMIGRRRGTGGSPGVAYLEQTLRYRAFPTLMRVRTFL